MYTGNLDATSNQETFVRDFEIVDDDTGDAVDLSTATIVFEFRDPDTKSTVASATTSNGKITLIDTGTFEVTFSRTDMQAIDPGIYDVGCVITIAGVTTQMMAAQIPVVDGVVAQ